MREGEGEQGLHVVRGLGPGVLGPAGGLLAGHPRLAQQGLEDVCL